MSGVLAALFVTAIELTGVKHLLFMLPLCMSVAVVYKTTRCANLREVPTAALVLWVAIVIGMCLVGLALWVLFQIMV